jgi:hypothetical protein
MKNIFGNNNSLRFLYDNSGRIISVNYLNDDGSVFRSVTLDYNGPMLIGLQREELSGNDFSINKTLSMSYDTDSNLSELKVFYPALMEAKRPILFTIFRNMTPKRMLMDSACCTLNFLNSSFFFLVFACRKIIL